MSEIAYLRMGSRSPDARWLFEALDAVMYDGQVSGIGFGRHFSRQQATIALQRLCRRYADGRASARTVRFLAQVVEWMGSEIDWVYIDFG